MNKLTLHVGGMHCHSCEAILERALKKVANVHKVVANQNKGFVEIFYGETAPDREIIESIIRENGYTVGVVKKPLPWFNTDYEIYAEIFAIAVIFFGAYKLLEQAGLSFPSIGNVGSPTLSIAFLVGLTAGVSSCMAMVGGAILGISAEWNQEHLQLSRWHRFEPHIYFNMGRVIGFGIFGGLLGLFGSFIHLSNTFLGSITVLVGIIMFILAMNLTKLSPRLGSISITLPKFLSRNFGTAPKWEQFSDLSCISEKSRSCPNKSPENSGRLSSADFGENKKIGKPESIQYKQYASPKLSAFTAGAFTFLLPCGFTLAMQAYAVSTGSFVTGMLVMSLFALGTAPGLLGIGGFTSFSSGNFGKYFFKFVGVLVLLLSFFNLSNGYTLLSLEGNSGKITQDTALTAPDSEVQEIRMIQWQDGYEPRIVTIKPNTKIRWIIESTNPYSCATQLIVPSLGISKNLTSGTNVIEFVSPASGEIDFSCSMGMYRGKLIVK